MIPAGRRAEARERPTAPTGGRSLLYRWQTFEAQATGTYCLGATFLTPEGKLWRAQSSGSVGTRAQPCIVAPDVQFLANWYPGGNVTPLTTAYGINQHGKQASVLWSDGQTTVAPLKNGAFLDARPETLQVRRIAILDAGGAVVRQ